jgi:uncharacterized membrane protein YqjE
MRHLPGLGPFDGISVVVDGHLRLIAAVAILAVFAMFGVLLWAMRRTRRSRLEMQAPKDVPPLDREKGRAKGRKAA